MNKSVLIIDDEQTQVRSLTKALKDKLPDVDFISTFAEEEIISAMENKFYSLAIVDLRMDKYSFDGIQLIEKIIEINPFSKIIVTSAFIQEYIDKLEHFFIKGKIINMLEKEKFDEWVPKIVNTINEYYETIEKDSSLLQKALLQYYADAKNEVDTYKKGEKFESFVSLLFGNIGYKDIKRRVIDKSRNEIDLIVRNEIKDLFLNKLGDYFLIECKNKPNEKIGKNDFIQFYSKLDNTNGLARFGFLFTAGYIAQTTYVEAVRISKSEKKVVFFSNTEIERLIKAEDMRTEFKNIIDEQVKDN
ncbi:MAG: response regulator [Porphyromonadaceae bacterium]|nr:response regulator [Porphyromonadaceae bacterium]